MENNEQSDFYAIKNKYLADALCFLGFSFYKYNDDGFVKYSFKRTDEFEKALSLQLELKKQFCNR